jgi:hypothetical protein
MRIPRILLLALVLGPTVVHAECRPSEATVRVQLTLQRPGEDEGNIAGVVLSVFYPADKLVIEGQGKDAAKAALGKLPDDVHAIYEDHDGELRLLFGKPEALIVKPLCEITFHRCEGATEEGAARAISCRVTDASDPASNKLRDVHCLVGEAS